MRAGAARTPPPVRHLRRSRRRRRCARPAPAEPLPLPPPAHESQSCSWRGFLPAFELSPIQHLAHHRAFSRQHAVHASLTRHLAESSPPGNHRHFQAQLLSRHHRPPEPRVIHGHKIKQLLLPVRHLLQEQHASGLRQRLDDQDRGHDRLAGKMPLKIPFVDADVLDPHDPLSRLHLDDRVHHQEGRPVRQDLLYAVGVKYHSLSPPRRPVRRLPLRPVYPVCPEPRGELRTAHRNFFIICDPAPERPDSSVQESVSATLGRSQKRGEFYSPNLSASGRETDRGWILESVLTSNYE